MKIVSLIDDRVFSYLKVHGVGSPNYIGNWDQFLPEGLNEAIAAHHWDKLPERNYDEIYGRVKEDPSFDQLLEVSHFKNWSTVENARWKIDNASELDIDFSLLHSKIEQTFTKYKVWITQINPGCCIPQHVDTVDAFVNDFNVAESDIKNIKRIVILPDAVKPWHHLWYGNEIIGKGTRGDAWSFNFWEPHGGGNLGPDPKYTLQLIAI
jgi:hypothetical protein